MKYGWKDKRIGTANVDVEMNKEGGGIRNHNPRGQLNDDAGLPYDKPGSLSMIELGCGKRVRVRWRCEMVKTDPRASRICR